MCSRVCVWVYVSARVRARVFVCVCIRGVSVYLVRACLRRFMCVCARTRPSIRLSVRKYVFVSVRALKQP